MCRCCVSKLTGAGVIDLSEPVSYFVLSVIVVCYAPLKTAHFHSSPPVASDADEPAVFFPVAPVLRTASLPVGLVTCTHLSPPFQPPLYVPPSLLCLRSPGDSGLAALQVLEHYVPVLHVYRGREGVFFPACCSFNRTGSERKPLSAPLH